jgi:hypothetical protein
VIAIAGGLGDDVAALQAHGVDASFSVVRRPCSLEEALAAAADNLRAAARNIAEVLRIGGGLPAGRSEADGRGLRPERPRPGASMGRWASGEDRPQRHLLALAQKPVWPPAVTLDLETV